MFRSRSFKDVLNSFKLKHKITQANSLSVPNLRVKRTDILREERNLEIEKKMLVVEVEVEVEVQRQQRRRSMSKQMKKIAVLGPTSMKKLEQFFLLLRSFRKRKPWE